MKRMNSAAALVEEELIRGSRLAQRGSVDHIQFHWRKAAANHLQFLRGGERQINHPSSHERPAVVDPDQDRLLVVWSRHLDERAEREGPMRSGEFVQVEYFTAGGSLAVVSTRVVGSNASFRRRDCSSRDRFVRRWTREHDRAR